MQLVALLRQYGFDPSAEDIADICWLALQRGFFTPQKDQPKQIEQSQQDTLVSPPVESLKSLPSIQEPSIINSTPLPVEEQPQQVLQEKAVTTTSPSAAPIYGYRSHSQLPSESFLAITLPSLPALANQLDLARALRPLMRRMPSLSRWTINEIASAEQIARTKIWMPVLQPIPSRWFDVMLVVDRAQSMQIWRPMIEEWRRILERQGAFRDVRIWSIVTDNPDHVQLMAGWNSVEGETRSPEELIDPSRRRIILFVSDCVAPAWQGGAIQNYLLRWGKYVHTAIVQVLPPELCSRTVLGFYDQVLLSPPSPGVSSSKLRICNSVDDDDGMPLPVIYITPAAQQLWASVVTGSNAVIGGRLIHASPLVFNEDSEDHLVLDAEDRVAIFFDSASDQAQKLARSLAFVPLSPPIMHLVHRLVNPNPQTSHMAEVLLGGLMRRYRREGQVLENDEVQYEFYPGVAEALQRGLTVSEQHTLLSRLMEVVMETSGRSINFRAILADPSLPEVAIFAQSNPTFASISANRLRKLGGKYAELAKRLDEYRIPHSVQDPDGFISQSNVSMSEPSALLASEPPEQHVAPDDTNEQIERLRVLRETTQEPATRTALDAAIRALQDKVGIRISDQIKDISIGDIFGVGRVMYAPTASVIQVSSASMRNISVEMPNPAVIIGLGGTGQWVLTYLKENLLDTYGGEIPPTVRLLSFDTTSQLGDIELESGSEFIYLGGNIEQICRDIRDKNAYPHIGSWLQARSYLQATDPRAFDISGGAGQKRPFGRMAVFYDLQQSIRAQITNKISTAISDVISANKKRTTVEIYVIASLAGGTGAGMFIDVAHLARWFAAKHIRTGYAIRGFLALHNTFNTVINTSQVQPNAFAAMRELDRFMSVFDQQYPIVYNSTNPDLNTIYGGQHGKLFDNCYLLDATRERMPLDGVPPKYGVYPSIADAITMLLDGTASDSYTQHFVNANSRVAQAQRHLKQPIYSSLGTFSLILPVEDIITSLAYRFGREVLADHLLNLQMRPNEVGQPQITLVYEGDAKKQAAEFLQRPKSEQGVISTNFIQRTPILVDTLTPYGVNSLEASELLAWIIPPESDPTAAELANKVREDLESRIATKVQPSNVEGDDPVEGCGRVTIGVRDFKEAYLGREVSGHKVGGIYQKALERCRDFHRERYRRLLQEYLTHLLNGPAPDNREYQREKRGKLGLAQAMLSHLSVSYFNEVSAFLDRVKAHRTKLQRAQEQAALLRSELENARNRTSFLGTFFKSLHPAVKAQLAYLEAEQAAVDLEMDDLVIEYLQQTTHVLRAETETFKATIDRWVNTLAKGLTGEVQDPGLYQHLSNLAARHQSQREEKEQRFQMVREYLTDPAYEQAIYAFQTEGKFAEVLAGMIWSIEEQAGSPQLALSGFMATGSTLRSGKSATERNADELIKIARRYFEPLRETLNIADRLAEIDSLRLVRKLRDSCAPMIRLDPLKSGGEQDMSYFVCVNEGRQHSYFREFDNELRQIGGSAREYQMLDSSNPYTCTILATADIFTSAGMHAYITAERAYNQHQGDARLLHIFPAEINAVHFEQQLPSIREERRRFSYTLTTMLENLEDVRLFMRAYLYRCIRLDAVDMRTSCWRLFTSNSGRRVGIFDLTPGEPQPKLLQAMETFVFRKADFINKTRMINFEQLSRELDQIEQEASGGDLSRQINMFEDLIDQDIDPMRQSRDQDMHDLGSLMLLMINETLENLKARLRISGAIYNPNATPLIDVRRRGLDQAPLA